MSILHLFETQSQKGPVSYIILYISNIFHCVFFFKILNFFLFLFCYAVCLDGSPPAYHLDRGSGTGVNSWLIQLEVLFCFSLLCSVCSC